MIVSIKLPYNEGGECRELSVFNEQTTVSWKEHCGESKGLLERQARD
jgi:hypothetical protein